MKSRYIGALCALCAVMVCACSDDAPAGANKTQKDMASVSDAGDMAMTQDTGAQEDAKVCLQMTCQTEQCGQVSDGCGGMLDCGTCECDQGMALGAQPCGPCGLGRPTCEEGQTSKETGCLAVSHARLEEIAAEQTCETRVVYVDGAATSLGDGSASAPYQTLSEAMSKAEAGDLIAVAKAEVAESEPVVVKEGVHVLGGLSSDEQGWRYTEPGMTPVLSTSLVPNLGRVGIVAEDINTPTTIEGLDVSTSDLEASAGTQLSNFGWVVTASNGLSLKRVNVKSGLATKGLDGTEGAPGQPGQDGLSSNHSVYIPRESPRVNRPAKAMGGASACGSSGGEGGRGGAPQSRSGQYSIIPGERGGRGETTTSLPGGMGGRGTQLGHLDGGDGEKGQDGAANPSSAQRGRNGTGEFVKSSTEFGLLWELQDGEGQDGFPGQAGSGGGGGGGGEHIPCLSSGSFFDRPWAWGPTGGGGGGGGCGGLEGTGGSHGGASIALVVLASRLSLSETLIVASAGGSGGAGGAGGAGGIGGEGNKGLDGTMTLEDQVCDVPCVDVPIQRIKCPVSGAGGKGGTGGPGGAGGGGAGGPSIGIYCDANTQISQTDLKASSLGKAKGGEGANMGAEGLSLSQSGCQ